MVFPKTSTLSPASTKEPVPAGTWATVPDGSPKLVVLLFVMVLLKTRTLVVPSVGPAGVPEAVTALGSAKTRMPPALSVAVLS